MAKPNKRAIEDLRGLTRLAVTATTGTTDLVETMHHTIELAHLPIGQSRATSTKGITGLVYSSVRGITRLVGTSLDLAMRAIKPFLEETEEPSKTRDDFLSAVNGVYGDRLVESGNSLALEMSFFYKQSELSVRRPDPEMANALNEKNKALPLGKVMVFVHGLCMNHHCWEKEESNLSSDLAEELGFNPIYLRYNTGLPIASNGVELANQLEALVDNWPTPITDLIIIGHSMGGLVSRSACHYGGQKACRWLAVTKTLVSMGTPHHGAPLEKSGKFLERLMQISPYAVPFTRLTKVRSQGIENLRHGSVTDINEECVSLPSGIEYFAIAAVLNKKSNPIAEQLVGDGLVPLDSALGQKKEPNRTLSIPSQNKWVGYEMGHIEMPSHPKIYEQLRNWF